MGQDHEPLIRQVETIARGCHPFYLSFQMTKKSAADLLTFTLNRKLRSMFLKVSEVSKKYGDHTVVDSISFTLEQRKKLAITGETGAGKSSLLKMIAGLLQPDGGSVFFEDKKLVGPQDQLLPGHPQIAYLPQDAELRNNYRMEELLEYANKIDTDKATALFRLCRITDLLKRKNNEISGGEKQRVALTRLLIGAPRLLLLDEPFSNLDLVHKQLLQQVVEDISATLNITCVITSHDPSDTLSWADEIMVLQNGRIIQCDIPETIYQLPANEYVAGLFGSYNLFSKEEAAMPGGNQLHKIGADLWFCRPEQVLLQKNTGSDPEATITRVYFRGSFYEWVLNMNGKTITARTSRKDFSINEKVSISLRQ